MITLRTSRLCLLMAALVTVAAISAPSCCAQEESFQHSVGSFWSWLSAGDVPVDGGIHLPHRPAEENVIVQLNHLLFRVWDDEEEFLKLTGTVPGMERFFQTLRDTQRHLRVELTKSNETCGVVPRQHKKNSWWRTILEELFNTPWIRPKDTTSNVDLNSEECLLEVLMSAKQNMSFVEKELDGLKTVVFGTFGGLFLPFQAKVPVYLIFSLFHQICVQLARSFFLSLHPLDMSFFSVQPQSTLCCLLCLAMALFSACCFVFHAKARFSLRRSEFHMDLIESYFAAPLSPELEFREQNQLQQSSERAQTSKFMTLFLKFKLADLMSQKCTAIPVKKYDS
jgi:hypothetical protein